MRQCYCPPQSNREKVPSGRKSPQIGSPRDGQRAVHFRGLYPQKLAGAKRFGVRQLAAAFAGRACSGAAGSKLPAKESGSKLPHSKGHRSGPGGSKKEFFKIAGTMREYY